MALKIDGNIYDCLYDAMQETTLTIKLEDMWSNADEINLEEEDLSGVYTTTVTYSETDIVKYEWVFLDVNPCLDSMYLKPSNFPDARIFGCLDYFNKNGITEDFISIEWSYEAFYEYDYAILDYSSPTFKEEAPDNQPDAVTVTFNGQQYQLTNKITKYIRIPKKTLEQYGNNWDSIVKDNFMGNIIIYCVTNHGEKYKETYTINKVEDNLIECAEYEIPLIHYEDEPIYYEEYKNSNVKFNKIKYCIKYVPYSIEEVL